MRAVLQGGLSVLVVSMRVRTFQNARMRVFFLCQPQKWDDLPGEVSWLSMYLSLRHLFSLSHSQ